VRVICAGLLSQRHQGERQRGLYWESEAPAEPKLGERGSCRTKTKLGRSLALPFKSQAGSFQSAARLTDGCNPPNFVGRVEKVSIIDMCQMLR